MWPTLSREIISTSQGYWVDSIRQVCKMHDTGQILSKYCFSSHPVPAKAPLSSSFSEDLSSGKQGHLVILSREFKLPEWEGQLATQLHFIWLQSCLLLELSLSLSLEGAVPRAHWPRPGLRQTLLL